MSKSAVSQWHISIKYATDEKTLISLQNVLQCHTKPCNIGSDTNLLYTTVKISHLHHV